MNRTFYTKSSSKLTIYRWNLMCTLLILPTIDIVRVAEEYLFFCSTLSSVRYLSIYYLLPLPDLQETVCWLCVKCYVCSGIADHVSSKYTQSKRVRLFCRQRIKNVSTNFRKKVRTDEKGFAIFPDISLGEEGTRPKRFAKRFLRFLSIWYISN